MKTKLWLFSKLLKFQLEQGITLTELLVALVISGLVLVGATNGFINILRANSGVESKSDRVNGMSRALISIQEDVKGAVAVTRKNATSGGDCNSSAVNSAQCLTIYSPITNNLDASDAVIASCDTPDTVIYYGYQDISSPSSSSVWLKPGILRRRVMTKNRSGDTCTYTAGNWTTVADGLISLNEPNPNPTCPPQSVGLTTGTPAIFGANASNLGGFRFCLRADDPSPNNTADLSADNRLVRVFLYGHVIDSDLPINVDTVTFARSER
ncbi:MAG: prepilin-type N-terminal cleavage/methylation domain-containing protein [Cyanobacterium sp. T60_A2020_053]|nr:prepilin-type N-terminal cleavage/methylation domain-containing protein [Cyanobacterium sp. T60_A2020_053]